MAAPTNHWKLGLFVVVGFVVALGSVLALGARSLQKKTVTYQSFFDESVQGLDVGSPVKFRGVTVGGVSVISVGPDHRHIGVTCELEAGRLEDLGLARAPAGLTRIVVPPDLRVQLGSSGLTGVRFISIDFFPTQDNPIRPPPFAVPENYIPSAQSTVKNLEDSVVHAVVRFPELADEIVRLLGKITLLLETVTDEHIPEQVSATLSRVNEVLGAADRALKSADVETLSRDARVTMSNVNTLVARMDPLIIGYYEETRWTENPEVYVRRALARALFDRRGIRQIVYGPATTLEVCVLAFEEVLAPLHVGRVLLAYSLADDRTVRVARAITVERAIAKATAEAAASAMVLALSAALADAVDGVAGQAVSELRAEGAVRAAGGGGAAARP